MRWKTPLTGSLAPTSGEILLGLYEDGALEIFRKEIDAGLQEKKNKSVKYARKLMEQEQTRKKLSQEASDGTVTLNDIAHKLDHVSEKLADLERQKTERLRIMKYANVDEEHLDRRDLILDQLDGKIRELDVARSD